MDSYENKLLDAIELMAETKVQEANFNRTVQATIIKMTNAATAEYLVKYQDSRFPAYSVNKSKQYKDGQNVYVLIPGNDTTQTKMIMGAVEKDIELATAIEDEYKYEIIGSNCVNSLNDTFELCSYTPDGDIKVLYDRENLINLIHLNTRDVQEYIKNNNILCCGADFKTQLPGEQQVKGNYGIVFELAFEDGLIKNYTVDINQMIGNPYKLTQYTTQKKYFEIGDNFLYVNKIYIFEKDFPYEELDKDNDIFVKNIIVEGAWNLTSDEVMSKRLVLSTPNGNYFSQIDPATEKIIQANIKDKGQIIDNTGIKYYWFKENNGIDLTSPKFNLMGGTGWEYLVEGIDNYTVKKEDLITEEQIYKCVTEIEGVIYSQVISIKNYNTEIQLSISSSNGTIFYYDMGNITLTCNIEGGDPSNEYSYAWTYQDSNEGIAFLDNTSNIQNVTIKDISLSRKYACSVYLDEHCIGTTSIILYNQTTVQNIQFQLKVLNGEVFYQYDEDGNKPNMDIKPIKCMLYDADGNEIDEEIFSKCEIVWTCPHDNTMLKNMIADMNNLTYTIEDRYDITKNNNKIGVQVKMDTQYIYQEFSINFIKAGENGTNGTRYIAKIICNAARDLEYPVFLEGNSTFWNFVPETPGRWFKVQLWKDNKQIFEGYDDPSNLVKLKWSILKNRYGGVTYDYSPLNVDTNGIFTSQGYVPPISTGYHSRCTVVQCEVEYDNVKIYCTKPLIEGESWPGNKAFLVEGSGYTSVQYNSQGRNPQYQNDIFELQILNQNGRDITQMGLTFNWSTYGQIWEKEEIDEEGHTESHWIDMPIVEIIEDDTLPAWKKRIVPVQEWSGECVNSGVMVEIFQNGTYMASLQIPIYGYLDRTVNQNIDGWNGNTIQLKTLDGGYIYTPQIGAGKKEVDQSFTGMIMGSAKEEGIKKIGLLGYSRGEQSLFLDAEKGGAIFGKGSQGGQMIIDPKANKSMLYSHNYWQYYNAKGFPLNYSNANKNEQGMIIDLTTPEIVFGNNNCKITSDGYLEYKGGLSSKGVATQLKYIAGWEYPGNGTGAAVADIGGIGALYYDQRPIGLSYGTLGFMPYATSTVTPSSSSPTLPSTIKYYRKTLSFSFILPEDFEISKVTAKCQYRQYQEDELSSSRASSNLWMSYPYIQDALLPLTQNLELYTNPSYYVQYTASWPDGETYTTAKTMGTLNEIGIYISENPSQQRFFTNTYQMTPDVMYAEGYEYCPDYSRFDNIDLDNKSTHLKNIDCSNAELNTTHFVNIDLTNEFQTYLETGKRYTVFFAPNESMPVKTINDYYKYDTYTNPNTGETIDRYKSRNTNMKEAIFGAISKSISFYSEVIIEGYLKTDAFNN